MINATKTLGTDGGNNVRARAEGPWSDLALYSIGWKAFQDLCSQVCEVVLQRPVEIFREAQDGGQDAVFLIPSRSGDALDVGSVQCKHSSDPQKQLRIGDLTAELTHIKELVQSGQAHTYIFMTSMSVDAPVAARLRKRLHELGVQKPHVLGKQYLVRAIRTSSRLRALVHRSPCASHPASGFFHRGFPRRRRCGQSSPSPFAKEGSRAGARYLRIATPGRS